MLVVLNAQRHGHWLTKELSDKEEKGTHTHTHLHSEILVKYTVQYKCSRT